MIKKFMKNVSPDTQTIINIVIHPGQTVELEATMWAKVQVNGALSHRIENGIIVMNDGTRDLSAEEGLKLLYRWQEIDVSTGGFPYRKIPVGVIVVVPEDFQMPVYQSLRVDGELKIEGEVIVK